MSDGTPIEVTDTQFEPLPDPASEKFRPVLERKLKALADAIDKMDIFEIVDGYTVDTKADPIATPLRTLTSTSTHADLLAFIRTFFRDVQQRGENKLEG